VAGASLAVNGTAALVLREHGGDLNIRSIGLHMAADAASALAVVVAGIVVVLAGRSAALADPAASLAVAALILVQAVRMLRESADVLLESAPSDVDLGQLREALTSVQGVGEVHDLHVWSLSSDYRALSAHLVLTGHPSLEDAQAVGGAAREQVSRRFGIAHTTFEMECERCDVEVADPCGIELPTLSPGSAPAPAGSAPRLPASTAQVPPRAFVLRTRRDPE
jgi:cobalt-zinc-cadmium efflux system protein